MFKQQLIDLAKAGFDLDLSSKEILVNILKVYDRKDIPFDSQLRLYILSFMINYLESVPDDNPEVKVIIRIILEIYQQKSQPVDFSGLAQQLALVQACQFQQNQQIAHQKEVIKAQQSRAHGLEEMLFFVPSHFLHQCDEIKNSPKDQIIETIQAVARENYCIPCHIEIYYIKKIYNYKAGRVFFVGDGKRFRNELTRYIVGLCETDRVFVTNLNQKIMNNKGQLVSRGNGNLELEDRIDVWLLNN